METETYITHMKEVQLGVAMLVMEEERRRLEKQQQLRKGPEAPFTEKHLTVLFLLMLGITVWFNGLT